MGKKGFSSRQRSRLCAVRSTEESLLDLYLPQFLLLSTTLQYFLVCSISVKPLRGLCLVFIHGQRASAGPQERAFPLSSSLL